MNEEIVRLPLEEVLGLDVYPTADIFPMMLDEAEPPAGYDGLTIHQFAEQILREGVREPLIVWNGILVDGRNRREATRIASKLSPEILAGLTFDPADISTVPVRYIEFSSFEEADSWVLSLNIDRRTMNADQRACLAVRYGWDVIPNRQGERSDLTSTDKSVDVASEAVGRARNWLKGFM